MEEISFQERRNNTYKEFKKTKDEIIKKEFELREILYRHFQENEGKHYEDIMKIASAECFPITTELHKLEMKKMGLEILFNCLSEIGFKED